MALTIISLSAIELYALTVRETSALSRNCRFARARRSVSASSWLQRLPVIVRRTRKRFALFEVSSSVSSPKRPRSQCEGPSARNSTRAFGNCSEGLRENKSQPAKVGTTSFPTGRTRSRRPVICSAHVSSISAGRHRSVRSAYWRRRACNSDRSNPEI
jgi:hypothetical protein